MDYISHIGRSIDDGAPIGSGRYPKGSGKNAYQHLPIKAPKNDFLNEVQKLKDKGLTTDKQLADAMNLSVQVFRDKRSLETTDLWFARRAASIELSDKGYSRQAIADILGVPNESNVRSFLNDARAARMEKTYTVQKELKSQVDKRKIIDVGPGVAEGMGISQEKLRAAMRGMEADGYQKITVDFPQLLNPGKTTTYTYLCAPGVTRQDIYDNRDKLVAIDSKSIDGGTTFTGNKPPVHIDKSRVAIRYAEDGGKEKDGMIELRKNVPDLNLGKANYAQVRIAVDKDLYLKGMAVYGDKLPKGKDIIFNTNKSKNVPFDEVLKPMKKTIDGKIDKDNPFGATIKEGESLKTVQRMYTDKDGKLKQSALNVVNEEGDWGKWRKRLPNQFLSKQSVDLIKSQLSIYQIDRKTEYEDILKIKNKTIKKALLNDFAEGCDKDACALTAKAFPRQSTAVILGIPSLKNNECFSPIHNNGTRLALVRYPHGGVFEIPILTVNNNNVEGRKIIGMQSVDAIGINSRTANTLSGADFDGDSVTRIPVRGKVKIKTIPNTSLGDFDTQEMFPYHKGQRGLVETKDQEQRLMGSCSNLLTDMTVKGATLDEIIPVVKYSMVVIDARKHKLDYKAAEELYNIKSLKRKWQGGANKGASTIFTRANADAHIKQRTLKRVNEMTPAEKKQWEAGKNIYKNTNKQRFDKKKQEYVPVLETVPKMLLTDDAYTLTTTGKKSTALLKEVIYADHANTLKEMARKARVVERGLENEKIDITAKQAYSKERENLKKQLTERAINKKLERDANVLASNNLYRKSKEGEYDKAQYKRLKNQLVTGARKAVGKERINITPTETEWEAILNGALSSTDTNEIIRALGPSGRSELRTKLGAKNNLGITPGQESKIKALLQRSDMYTIADIAEEVGVSESTIQKIKKGGM